jgi:hypothetical protein
MSLGEVLASAIFGILAADHEELFSLQCLECCNSILPKSDRSATFLNRQLRPKRTHAPQR